MGKTGLHINFEGIDGVGKTTQYDLLAKKIGGFQVSSYTYDGIKNIRKRIEELSICNLDLRCSYYLMSSLHDNEVIKEKVQGGEDVVSDRGILSTLAYHRAMGSSLAKGIDLEKLNIRLPDYTIHLKLSEEERMQRIGLRGAELGDKYWERDSKLMTQVLEEYEGLSSHMIDIDTNGKTIDEVSNEIMKILEK